MRLVMTLMAVGLLLVVGCGGGGDENTGTGGGAEPEGPDAARQIQPDAQARAESLVIELSDLPVDWRGTAPDDDDSSEEFLSCVGTDISEFTIIGEAKSQDFSMGSSEVSSESSLFKSSDEAQSAATEYVAGLQGAEASACFKDLLQEAFDEEGEEGVSYEVGEVEVGEINVREPVGVEEASAIQVEVPIEVDGQSATLILEDVLLRQGDAVVEVITDDQEGPLDSELRDQLVQVMATRMSGGASADVAPESWPATWCEVSPGIGREALYNQMGPPTQPDSGYIALIPTDTDSFPPEPAGQDSWEAPGSYRFTAFYGADSKVQQLDFSGPESELGCENSRASA